MSFLEFIMFLEMRKLLILFFLTVITVICVLSLMLTYSKKDDLKEEMKALELILRLHKLNELSLV